MLVTLSGIVTLVSPVHPENAQSPILVTPLPSSTALRRRQESNALLPIVVTLSEIVILTRYLQLSNALSPMLNTGLPLYLEGITTSVEKPLYPTISYAELSSLSTKINPSVYSTFLPVTDDTPRDIQVVPLS